MKGRQLLYVCRSCLSYIRFICRVPLSSLVFFICYFLIRCWRCQNLESEAHKRPVNTYCMCSKATHSCFCNVFWYSLLTFVPWSMKKRFPWSIGFHRFQRWNHNFCPTSPWFKDWNVSGPFLPKTPREVTQSHLKQMVQKGVTSHPWKEWKRLDKSGKEYKRSKHLPPTLYFSLVGNAITLHETNIAHENRPPQ